MDRKRDNKALYVMVTPSKWAGRVMRAMYWAAAGTVLISGAPMTVKAGLVILLLGGLLATMVGHGARIDALGCDDDGQWWIRQTGGAHVMVCILPDTVVLPRLVLLSMRCECGRYHRLPLMADAVGADDFRHLRVRLRAGVAGAAASVTQGGGAGMLTRLTSRWSRREGADGR